MFHNPFGTDPHKADLANQSLAIQLTTLNIALLDKGFISETEFEHYRAQATHLVKELWAQKTKEDHQHIRDAHPGIHDIVERGFIGDNQIEEHEGPADSA